MSGSSSIVDQEIYPITSGALIPAHKTCVADFCKFLVVLHSGDLYVLIVTKETDSLVPMDTPTPCLICEIDSKSINTVTQM